MSNPSSGAAGSGGGVNWKNPSEVQMQKYGVRPVPDGFVPTVEEEMLLDMYVIRSHERVSHRLREEAARAKLAARDAEFQQLQQQRAASSAKGKKRPKKPKREKILDEGDDDDNDDDEELEEVVDDDEEEDVELEDDEYERREARLEALREEVEEAKQSQEDKAEQMREKLLAEGNEELDDGVSLKRKRKDFTAEPPSSSLIANITGGATPPHEFSKKLELTAGRGKTLFPRSIEESRWSPPEGVFAPNDRAFEVELENFDVSKAQNGQGNNTIAIKFTAPSDAKRFSVNIAGADHDEYNSVLFHFNPRQHERGGQLVVNDKQESIWGQAIAIPLSQVPKIFGQTACTLMIQINGDGFDIFLEDKHCARLEHRKELPSGNNSLFLQFPSTDDYGSRENWIVYKVWWGNRPIMTKGDISGVAGVNTYNTLHPRKLFVSRLPKIHSQPEVDLRKAELERAFRKYGGDRGVHVIAPTNSTYAFVEMESERQADLALSEMATMYQLNRARRSKHEALQEERAAKEAAKAAGNRKKESSGWD